MRRSGLGSTHPPPPPLIHNTHMGVKRANRRRRRRWYKRCPPIPQVTTNFNQTPAIASADKNDTSIRTLSVWKLKQWSGFGVLAVMTMKVAVFLDLTPCSVVRQVSMFRTERINVAVTFYTRIRKAVGSNLKPDTCYRDWEFSWKFRHITSIRPQSFPFKSFPIHH
jgi:hypothetical protein